MAGNDDCGTTFCPFAFTAGALDPNAGAELPKLGAGALDPNDGAGLPKLGAGAGLLKPPLTGAGGVYVVPNCAPPLLAPLSFSCVRPYAATPMIAPMAIWNKPAPCSVIGCH